MRRLAPAAALLAVAVLPVRAQDAEVERRLASPCPGIPGAGSLAEALAPIEGCGLEVTVEPSLEASLPEVRVDVNVAGRTAAEILDLLAEVLDVEWRVEGGRIVLGFERAAIAFERGRGLGPVIEALVPELPSWRSAAGATLEVEDGFVRIAHFRKAVEQSLRLIGDLNRLASTSFLVAAEIMDGATRRSGELELRAGDAGRPLPEIEVSVLPTPDPDRVLISLTAPQAGWGIAVESRAVVPVGQWFVAVGAVRGGSDRSLRLRLEAVPRPPEPVAEEPPLDARSARELERMQATRVGGEDYRNLAFRVFLDRLRGRYGLEGIDLAPPGTCEARVDLSLRQASLADLVELAAISNGLSWRLRHGVVLVEPAGAEEVARLIDARFAGGLEAHRDEAPAISAGGFELEIGRRDAASGMDSRFAGRLHLLPETQLFEVTAGEDHFRFLGPTPGEVRFSLGGEWATIRDGRLETGDAVEIRTTPLGM